MRVLVIGAGAVGGYFGARLLEAGRDVTFLVRPRRAGQLAERGLRVKSPLGDLALPSPPTVLAADLATPFDLILLSCKAYDLDDAIEAFAPAVGPRSAILPLLNGLSHLDVLDRRFGAPRILGGLCVIGATLDENGDVAHLNQSHAITYGERDGTRSARIDAIDELVAGANFKARASDSILLEMWEKWVFLASLAAGTCLMRAAVGEIVSAPGGAAFMGGLLDECVAIATAEGSPPRPKYLETCKTMLSDPRSKMTASMLRDVERGARTEADHVIGDLLGRGERHGLGGDRSLLSLAYTHLKAYEARGARAP